MQMVLTESSALSLVSPDLASMILGKGQLREFSLSENGRMVAYELLRSDNEDGFTIKRRGLVVTDCRRDILVRMAQTCGIHIGRPPKQDEEPDDQARHTQHAPLRTGWGQV